MFRDAAGVARTALTLPEKVCHPIGDIVLDAAARQGVAVSGQPVECDAGLGRERPGSVCCR